MSTHGQSASDQTFRSILAEHFENQARWRYSVFDRFPTDFRNERSAQTLDELADHVRKLPVDDPNLRALELLQEPYGLDVILLGEAASYAVSRFGFDSEERDPDRFDEFLAQIVALQAEDEAAEADDSLRWEGLISE